MSFLTQSSLADDLSEGEEDSDSKDPSCFEEVLYPASDQSGSRERPISGDSISVHTGSVTSDVGRSVIDKSPLSAFAAAKLPMRPVLSLPAFTLESPATSTLVLAGAKHAHFAPGIKRVVVFDGAPPEYPEYPPEAPRRPPASLKYSVAFREIVPMPPGVGFQAVDELGRVITTFSSEFYPDEGYGYGYDYGYYAHPPEILPAKPLVAIVIQDIDYSTRIGFLVDENESMTSLAEAYLRLRGLPIRDFRVTLYRKTSEFVLDPLILELSPRILKITNFQVLFSEVRPL